MDGLPGRQIAGWMYIGRWTNERVDGQIDRWAYGQTGRRMDGWVSRWLNGYMNEQMYRQMGGQIYG